MDVVGNFCFVHPAKAGISSNLNLITDKGNIYSFTLQDVSNSSVPPDLKVLVQPADQSSIVASSGPAQYVPAAQLDQSKQQLAALQTHVGQAVDEYKSAYQSKLTFDYHFKANEKPFDIQSIYHDDKFTYNQDQCSREVQRVRDEGRKAEPHLLRLEGRDLHHPEGDGLRLCRTWQAEDGVFPQRLVPTPKRGREHHGRDSQHITAI